VDGYRSAYVRARRETSGIGAEYRLFCLTGAGSVLQDGSCAAGADDTAFFRKVGTRLTVRVRFLLVA
jgi:hypothetical protein